MVSESPPGKRCFLHSLLGPGSWFDFCGDVATTGSFSSTYRQWMGNSAERDLIGTS